jgi:hypothetical protein
MESGLSLRQSIISKKIIHNHLEEIMKQIEKDVIMLGMISDFVKGYGKKINDYIPEYQGDKVCKFGEKVILNDEHLEGMLKKLASDCYRRVKKKLD